MWISCRWIIRGWCQLRCRRDFPDDVRKPARRCKLAKRLKNFDKRLCRRKLLWVVCSNVTWQGPREYITWNPVGGGGITEGFRNFRVFPLSPYLGAFHLAGLRLGFALHMLFIDTIFRENLFLENFYSLPSLRAVGLAWMKNTKTPCNIITLSNLCIYAYGFTQIFCQMILVQH